MKRDTGKLWYGNTHPGNVLSMSPHIHFQISHIKFIKVCPSMGWIKHYSIYVYYTFYEYYTCTKCNLDNF